MVQKVFGIRETKNGTKASELLQTGTNGHQRIWQNDGKNPNSRERKSPSQRGKERENQGRKEKKRITRKEYQRLFNKFYMEGLMAQEGLWKLAKEKITKERGELLDEVGDAVREYRAMHEGNFWSSWLKEDEAKRRERQETRRRKKKG